MKVLLFGCFFPVDVCLASTQAVHLTSLKWDTDIYKAQIEVMWGRKEGTCI